MHRGGPEMYRQIKYGVQAESIRYTSNRATTPSAPETKQDAKWNLLCLHAPPN